MKFRMYMGISGSGKTTIAYKQACANTKVFDSDEVRQLLFNDATYQGDNTKVFGYNVLTEILLYKNAAKRDFSPADPISEQGEIAKQRIVWKKTGQRLRKLERGTH